MMLWLSWTHGGRRSTPLPRSPLSQKRAARSNWPMATQTPPSPRCGRRAGAGGARSTRQFEAARARLFVAGALRASGHESNATGELEAALGAFERLGAIREAERVRSMLHGARRSRATCTLMFTDIVDSTRLVEVLGDDVWGNLLGWHDRTLRQCVDAHNGREINHEGDGFFISFTDSFDAVECSIAIQRTLADHRREHGFAPQVRIGVHSTEAVDLGDDYLGKGVHELPVSVPPPVLERSL